MTLKSKLKRAVSRLPWSRRSTLYCSFCSKSQHEVEKLIAGPSVFICDGCVGLCNQILGKPPGDTTPVVKMEDISAMPSDKLLRWLAIQGGIFDSARLALQEAVDTLREREVSWATIGEALGVSRQAAWDRFS